MLDFVTVVCVGLLTGCILSMAAGSYVTTMLTQEENRACDGCASVEDFDVSGMLSCCPFDDGFRWALSRLHQVCV